MNIQIGDLITVDVPLEQRYNGTVYQIDENNHVWVESGGIYDPIRLELAYRQHIIAINGITFIDELLTI